MMEKVGGAHPLATWLRVIHQIQAPLNSLDPATQIGNFIGPCDLCQMECHQTMLDSRQTRFDTGKPKTHLGLNFIQLAMYTPEHFMGEVFNVVGHGGSLVGHRSKVYHEVIGGVAGMARHVGGVG
jgi:hypothetical protein